MLANSPFNDELALRQSVCFEACVGGGGEPCAEFRCSAAAPTVWFARLCKDSRNVPRRWDVLPPRRKDPLCSSLPREAPAVDGQELFVLHSCGRLAVWQSLVCICAQTVAGLKERFKMSRPNEPEVDSRLSRLFWCLASASPKQKQTERLFRALWVRWGPLKVDVNLNTLNS